MNKLFRKTLFSMMAFALALVFAASFFTSEPVTASENAEAVVTFQTVEPAGQVEAPDQIVDINKMFVESTKFRAVYKIPQSSTIRLTINPTIASYRHGTGRHDFTIDNVFPGYANTRAREQV